MKKYVIPALVIIGLIVAFIFFDKYIKPLTDALTEGMSNRETGRVEMIIVTLPIIAICFLVDYIKKR